MANSVWLEQPTIACFFGASWGIQMTRTAERNSWCLCNGISILIKDNRGLALIEVIAFSMVNGFISLSYLAWVLLVMIKSWAVGKTQAIFLENSHYSNYSLPALLQMGQNTTSWYKIILKKNHKSDCKLQILLLIIYHFHISYIYI